MATTKQWPFKAPAHLTKDSTEFFRKTAEAYEL